MPRNRLKPLKPGRTEAQVLEQVLQALAIYGIDADRQNTGGMLNPKGQYVPFGRPGNSDVTGMIPGAWGDASGRKLDIEVKREGFDPRKVRGKARERWERQLARLRRTNENGGYAAWVTDAAHVIKVLEGIKAGYRVVIGEDEWPYLTNEGE